MCMYIYIYIQVYAYIYIYIYGSVRLISLSKTTFLHTENKLNINIYIYIYTYIYIYIYIYGSLSLIPLPNFRPWAAPILVRNTTGGQTSVFARNGSRTDITAWNLDGSSPNHAARLFQDMSQYEKWHLTTKTTVGDLARYQRWMTENVDLSQNGPKLDSWPKLIQKRIGSPKRVLKYHIAPQTNEKLPYLNPSILLIGGWGEWVRL